MQEIFIRVIQDFEYDSLNLKSIILKREKERNKNETQKIIHKLQDFFFVLGQQEEKQLENSSETVGIQR